MGESISNTRGFTLVEISIVMIIIGLLIGGTFGGMKLIENMQVNKTVQDLKAIESAALTFRDSYGRLPGDMPNTAARLPSCTDAPCATGGNGDRVLDNGLTAFGAIAATNERFTFWHHLQAADLLSMGYSNTIQMEFGDGQPDAPIGGGYRVTHHTGAMSAPGCLTSAARTVVSVASDAAAAYGTSSNLACAVLDSVDAKIDDGRPYTGRATNWGSAGCVVTAYACDTAYNRAGGNLYVFGYDVAF